MAWIPSARGKERRQPRSKSALVAAILITGSTGRRRSGDRRGAHRSAPPRRRAGPHHGAAGRRPAPHRRRGRGDRRRPERSKRGARPLRASAHCARLSRRVVTHPLGTSRADRGCHEWTFHKAVAPQSVVDSARRDVRVDTAAELTRASNAMGWGMVDAVTGYTIGTGRRCFLAVYFVLRLRPSNSGGRSCVSGGGRQVSSLTRASIDATPGGPAVERVWRDAHVLRPLGCRLVGAALERSLEFVHGPAGRSSRFRCGPREGREPFRRPSVLERSLRSSTISWATLRSLTLVCDETRVR